MRLRLIVWMIQSFQSIAVYLGTNSSFGSGEGGNGLKKPRHSIDKWQREIKLDSFKAEMCPSPHSLWTQTHTGTQTHIWMQCKSSPLGQSTPIAHYGAISKSRSKHEFHSPHNISAQKCWLRSESEPYIIITGLT